MTVAQILFTCAAFLKIAIIIYPAREQVYIFYKFPRTTAVHFTITFIMTLFTFAVPCVYPNVTNLLGLIGGIMTGSLGYSIPLTLKLISLWPKGVSLSFVFHSILLIIVLVIQIMGTYVSIVNHD